MLVQENERWQVYQYPVGPMQANCYFLVDAATKNTIIIDPGAEGDVLSDELFARGFQPQLVFLTHGHSDHVGGILPLWANFFTPIYLDEKDYFLYKRAQSTTTHFTKLPADPVIDDRFLLKKTDLEMILDDWPETITLLACPGHTPGLTGLHLPMSHWFFGGDLLFAAGQIGRTDFAYAQAQLMRESLQKIATLPHPLTIFPGHGEIFTRFQ